MWYILTLPSSRLCVNGHFRAHPVSGGLFGTGLFHIFMLMCSLFILLAVLFVFSFRTVLWIGVLQRLWHTELESCIALDTPEWSVTNIESKKRRCLHFYLWCIQRRGKCVIKLQGRSQRRCYSWLTANCAIRVPQGNLGDSSIDRQHSSPHTVVVLEALKTCSMQLPCSGILQDSCCVDFGHIVAA